MTTKANTATTNMATPASDAPACTFGSLACLHSVRWPHASAGASLSFQLLLGSGRRNATATPLHVGPLFVLFCGSGRCAAARAER